MRILCGHAKWAMANHGVLGAWRPELRTKWRPELLSSKLSKGAAVGALDIRATSKIDRRFCTRGCILLGLVDP